MILHGLSLGQCKSQVQLKHPLPAREKFLSVPLIRVACIFIGNDSTRLLLTMMMFKLNILNLCYTQGFLGQHSTYFLINKQIKTYIR